MRKFKKFCEHFSEYVEEYGDGFVPYKYVSKDGYRLGFQIFQIRAKRCILNSEERDILNSLHFEWNGKRKKIFNSTFEQYFAAIKEYYEKNGNCDIPEKYINENGIQVGIMVVRLRTIKEYLNSRQIKRLDEIGFSWHKKNKKVPFEIFCRMHKKYEQEKGHCHIPVRYVDENGIKLGEIARNIRSDRIIINDEQRKILDSIGFVWNPVAYRREHGLIKRIPK